MSGLRPSGASGALVLNATFEPLGVVSVRRAAILVPFPFAADDHQTKNAQAMVEENAAVLVGGSLPTELFESIRSRWREVANERWAGQT